MILTRYLYNKEYVEYSLFISLIERNSDEAMFWCYELYFSGFKKHVFSLLWFHYYNLYAPFYVRLEKYFYKKTKLWLQNMDDHTIIGTLCMNLVTREPCVDFYFMKKNSIPYPSILIPYIEKLDYLNNFEVLNTFIKENHCFTTIAKNTYSNLQYVYSHISILTSHILKLACISRMFSGMFLNDENNRLDKNFFILLKRDHITEYLNKPFIKMRTWKTPHKRCIYDVKLPPRHEKMEFDVYYNWLYYASHSPIWERRIKRYQGCIVDDERVVDFPNDDDLEDFFNYYDMEPDEQPREVIDKWLGVQPYNSYKEIYDKYSLPILKEWLKQNNL